MYRNRKVVTDRSIAVVGLEMFFSKKKFSMTISIVEPLLFFHYIT